MTDKQENPGKSDRPDAPKVGVAAHQDELARARAPYRNAEITLIDRPSEDVALIELRIREGRRITTVELDAAGARLLGESFVKWAKTHQQKDA